MANLVDLLRADAVPMATLHDRYGPLLELVRELIGVVPNCDPYLEIWPTAFRSYNVMVPNLLNLPVGVWAPDPAVGLALYVASRTAGCAYCSAHTCSFALRRGAAADTVARAVDADPAGTARDRAVIAVANKLAAVPAALTDADRVALVAACGARRAEWIVHGVAMMGFLNKLMDALGVELEPETVAEVAPVIAASGWTPGKHGPAPDRITAPPRKDTLATKLRIVPKLPAALRFDRAWTAGVPDRWPAVGDFLRERTGHAFPLLGRLRHRRPIRAIATMLADNFGGTGSVLGLATKRAAATAYAQAVGNAALAGELATLHAPSREVDRAALVVARAIAPSPAAVDDAALATARTLPPAAIVELVTAVSVTQLVHRLGSYYT